LLLSIGLIRSHGVDEASRLLAMAVSARGHPRPSPHLHQRVQRWQDTRTWARLIREAEALWHVDVRDLRRLGALELSQLLEGVPPPLRPRVNRWLACYRVHTRLQ